MLDNTAQVRSATTWALENTGQVCSGVTWPFKDTTLACSGSTWVQAPLGRSKPLHKGAFERTLQENDLGFSRTLQHFTLFTLL